MTPALALPAPVMDPIGSKPDDEQMVFVARVEALRRLSPVKARLLGLIVAEMLREARDRAEEHG